MQSVTQGTTHFDVPPQPTSLASMSPQTTELNLSIKPPSIVDTTSNIIRTVPKTDYTPRTVSFDSQHVPSATADDTSSSLSDIEDRPTNELLDENRIRSAQVSDDEDTEAETERLDESPRKLRKQKNVVLGSTRGDDNGDSATVQQSGPQKQNDTLQDGRHMNGLVTGDIGFEDDQNPASDISSLGDSVTETSQPASPAMKAGKKRKRPDRDLIESDQDVTIESLKKVAAHLASHVKHSSERAENNELNIVVDDDHLVDRTEVSKSDGAVSTLQHPRVSDSYLGKRRSRTDGIANVEVTEDGGNKWGDAGTKDIPRDAKSAADAESSNGEDFEIGDEAEAEITARNEEESKLECND